MNSISFVGVSPFIAYRLLRTLSWGYSGNRMACSFENYLAGTDDEAIAGGFNDRSRDGREGHSR